MTKAEVFEEIRAAVNAASDHFQTAEMHLQIIKHAEVLSETTGREFCERVGLGGSYKAEFSKMRKIVPRLVAAGLRVEDI